MNTENWRISVFNKIFKHFKNKKHKTLKITYFRVMCNRALKEEKQRFYENENRKRLKKKNKRH
jgi:hypothetical protein